MRAPTDTPQRSAPQAQHAQASGRPEQSMQVVILAGGLGTRISEESSVRPKPMVEIGGKPILWHIMKSYMAHGLDDFIICCGYKGHVIKQFFRDYGLDGAHPGLFTTEHLDGLRQSSAWFARKFPVEPQAAVRQQVLRDLVGVAHGPALSELAA